MSRLLSKQNFILSIVCSLLLASCSDPDKDIPKENRIPLLPQKETLSVNLKENPTLSAPVLNSDWKQVGGLSFKDLGNLAGNTNLKEKWSVSIGDVSDDTMETIAQPVISGGHILVLNAEGEVVCVNSQTGKIIWERSLIDDNEDDANPRGGGIAIEGDIAVVTTGMGMIFGLSLEDGKIRWRIDNRVPFTAAPTVSDGMAYVIDRDNRLQALEAQTGKSLWDYRALPEVVSYPKVASPSVISGVVIAPFTSGEIVAIDAKTSKAAWGRNIVGSGLDAQAGKFNTISAQPVIAGRHIFVGVPSGMFAAFDGSSGKEIWHQELSVESTPLSAGNALYVVDMSARLIAFEKDTGRIFFITQLPQYEDKDDKDTVISWHSPLMLDGKLLLTSYNGYAYSVDGVSGEILSKKEISEVWSDPIVAGGVVYLLDKGGRLKAFE